VSRYAFDLDDTLDVPVIAQLARDLHAAGHEVHVVTGCPADVGEWTVQARHEKLARLNVPFTELHRCWGQDIHSIGVSKGIVLRSLGDPLFIDDNPGLIRGAATISSCTKLWVVR
jgi:hypothetical protein